MGVWVSRWESCEVMRGWMWREGSGENEQCCDQETPGRLEGDEWGREQENWTGGGRANEDGERPQISGDRDCELCAGNKQGRNR